MPESPVQASPVIEGVYTVPLLVFADERGRFMETFRKEWFPQVSWNYMQSNRSDSQASVLRGLHYHAKQVDYWYVAEGQIRAGLVDLRRSSPTYLQSMTVEMDSQDNNHGLFIPIGVAHGFLALTDCTLIYIVNNYYDGDDEFGIAWNDPQADVQWQVDNPILSERDRRNPFIADIPETNRPT